MMARKSVIYLLILVHLWTNAISQQTDLLLVGTIHHIPDSLSANWVKLKKTLFDYKPTVFCIEYRIPSDSISLRNANGPNVFKRLDSIRNSWAAKPALLSLSNQNAAYTLELFARYYVAADFGNAHYQAFKFHKEFPELLITHSDNDIIKLLFAVKGRLKENEYWNVIFPVADSLRITYLYPCDNWTFNIDIGAAYGKWSGELKDGPYMEKWNNFYKQFNAQENQHILEKDAIEFINTPEWLKTANTAQTELLNESKNINYDNWVNFWFKRNQKIAGNIITVIEQTKPQRAVVFFGYMHVPAIKRFLQPGPGFIVTLYQNM